MYEKFVYVRKENQNEQEQSEKCCYKNTMRCYGASIRSDTYCDIGSKWL